MNFLSKDKLSKIYLKKINKWENDNIIIPVEPIYTSATRKEFVKTIHSKNIGQIRAYWQQAIFSGKSTPPIEKLNDAEIIEFVQRNPSAIGYVSSNTKINGVKIINIE